MLKVVKGSAIRDNCALMEKIWRFRHEQFVVRLGWDDLYREDGREIDQFDTEHAIHLPLLIDGRVVGYSRFLPTTRPHLLSAVYPELIESVNYTKSETVYEWTRCIADRSAGRINGVLSSNVLMTSVLEFCLRTGISSIIAETYPSVALLLRHNGWSVRFLGEPKHYKNQEIVAIEAIPSLSALKRCRSIYGINFDIVDMSDFVLNDREYFPNFDNAGRGIVSMRF